MQWTASMEVLLPSSPSPTGLGSESDVGGGVDSKGGRVTERGSRERETDERETERRALKEERRKGG